MKRLLITSAIAMLITACGAGSTGAVLELNGGATTESTVRAEVRGFLGELSDADVALTCAPLPEADAPIADFAELVSATAPPQDRMDHARALQIIAEECAAR